MPDNWYQELSRNQALPPTAVPYVELAAQLRAVTQQRDNLVIEKQGVDEVTETLRARISKLEDDLRQANKAAPVQRTIDSMLPKASGQFSNKTVAVATVFGSPREVIHRLGIRKEDGSQLPDQYIRNTKYDAPVLTMKDSQPKQYKRLLYVSRCAVSTIMGGLHSDSTQHKPLLQALAGISDDAKSAFVDEAMVRNCVQAYNDSQGEEIYPIRGTVCVVWTT